MLAYCKLAELADDAETMALVESLYDAAVGYMEDAGIAEPDEGTTRKAKYDLCVNYLVLDGLDRRDMNIVSTVITENPAFRRLINQLMFTENTEDAE